MVRDLKTLTNEEINRVYSSIQDVIQNQDNKYKLESLDKWNNFIHIRNGEDNVIGTLNTISQIISIKDNRYADKLKILSYFIGKGLDEKWDYKKGIGVSG